MERTPRVVVVGGGFGGLTLAQCLKDAPVAVTLMDKSNHHLFQPLLYQVAMAGLSPAEIASPIRSILRQQENTRVLLTHVTQVDLARRVVVTTDGEHPYDVVVLAAGARTSYFGHEAQWSPHALGLKTIDDALEIRRRVLTAFEEAEKTQDEARQKQLLTFVVIGGGPTGVELAGSLAELATFVLDRDFRNIRPGAARVILLEAGERILSSFDPRLSSSAVEGLTQLGVEVRTGARVTNIDAHGVALGAELIPSVTVMWGAGICGVELAHTLGVPLDRSGRVIVEKDCTIPGHPNAFCIGDMAVFLHQTGQPLPGVSPVAMQQARYVARLIVDGQPPERRPAFHYVDKGSMATIGRSRAVAETGPFKLKGFLAWMAWLMVHIWYLIGFRNRFIVMFNWAWNYFTYKRGARLITGGLAPVVTSEKDAVSTPVRPGLPAPPAQH